MTKVDSHIRFYREQAPLYDALISAEDADATLQNMLLETINIGGKSVADIGAGTGRLARWFAPHASHLHLVDRAQPMLDIAQTHLEREGFASKVNLHNAEVSALPLDSASVDVATAGWVFGHFRQWMPEGWKAEVDAAIAEMKRIVIGKGPLVIIETLGTGHTLPRKHHELDEYFEHLQSHGFTRKWVRTDYVFKTVEDACQTMSEFFGQSLVDTIRKNKWTRVPECTAIFTLAL